MKCQQRQYISLQHKHTIKNKTKQNIYPTTLNKTTQDISNNEYLQQKQHIQLNIKIRAYLSSLIHGPKKIKIKKSL